MYKIILGQHYYKKEQNETVGYQRVDEKLTDYSKKVYRKINEFLLGEVSDTDIESKETYLISEILLNIQVEGVNENQEEIYMDIEEFRNDEVLASKNKNIQLEFNSEVKFINQDILNIMEILKKSIQKEIRNILMNKR